MFLLEVRNHALEFAVAVEHEVGAFGQFSATGPLEGEALPRAARTERPFIKPLPEPAIRVQG